MRSRSERGQAAVELAVLLPLLVVLIFSGVQVALWFHAGHVATAAAQEGAAAARAAGGSAEAGRARAQAVLAQLGRRLLADGQVTAVREAGAARVEVRGRALAVLPGLTLSVRGVAESPLERFVAETER